MSCLSMISQHPRISSDWTICVTCPLCSDYQQQDYICGPLGCMSSVEEVDTEIKLWVSLNKGHYMDMRGQPTYPLQSFCQYSFVIHTCYLAALLFKKSQVPITVYLPMCFSCVVGSISSNDPCLMLFIPSCCLLPSLWVESSNFF